MGDYIFLELDATDLVPYFSWRRQYFKTIIGSCKVTSLKSDWLLIVASIILVLSPSIVSVVSVCFLVGPTPYLFWCEIITSSCSGIWILVCASLFFWWKSCLCNDLTVVENIYIRMCYWNPRIHCLLYYSVCTYMRTIGVDFFLFKLWLCSFTVLSYSTQWL